MTRMTFPPLNELKPGELADFYEVTRNGQPIMVARNELTYQERTAIATELRAEGTSDIAFANRMLQ